MGFIDKFDPKITSPINQGKPWAKSDKEAISARYSQLLNSSMKKKDIVHVLCEDFGRGRFAITKLLDKKVTIYLSKAVCPFSSEARQYEMIFIKNGADLDRALKEGWLSADAQIGWRNADGSRRRAKYKIKFDSISDWCRI